MIRACRNDMLVNGGMMVHHIKFSQPYYEWLRFGLINCRLVADGRLNSS